MGPGIGRGMPMKKKSHSAYEIGSAIDPGRKRSGKANQDSLMVILSENGHRMQPVLVIADGMGGYAGGQIASQIVIQEFTRKFSEIMETDYSFEKYASIAIDTALDEMQRRAEADPELGSMGSTVVSVCVDEGLVHVANVGDSRAYLIHEGEIRQINYDHSFVGEAVRAGLLTAAEAMNHPRKNQLTQSISAKRPAVKPFFDTLPLDENDLLLLCSDGLWGVVPEAMIQAVVTEMPPQKAAEKLIKLANSRGGPDNISVIVCRKAGSKPLNPFIRPDEKINNGKPFSLFKRRRGE